MADGGPILTDGTWAWLGPLATLIIGAGGAWVLKVLQARWGNKRQVRLDEIAVLHQAIEDLRKDRDGLRSDLDSVRLSRDRDMAALKSEHTACLIEQERLRASEKYLMERMASLEEDVKRLQGAGRG
jgi:hypothetical protein